MIPGTIPGIARDRFPWGMEGIGKERKGELVPDLICGWSVVTNPSIVKAVDAQARRRWMAR